MTERRRLVLSGVEVSNTDDNFPATYFKLLEGGIPLKAVTSFSLKESGNEKNFLQYSKNYK
ncbi:hypothetical protein A2924_00485 [Candidatus Giovannonibacteria bacterium RIFCSPLOWO2_01_FULL_44_16]|uniref:Uncharacterized protein n=1 Tax=Candidatus Giovannonibacteria bacterium RIFCSPLOWO2_01_FULL_44_16 TaxID=1798348 RepID=A0A1F5X2Q3_9BACT|nr:MAG: hypothetical protein A2924_00485 [Candidatus Giovannonibacteria bacterium RIFCSPLOWO2_01_FULL_44_16]